MVRTLLLALVVLCAALGPGGAVDPNAPPAPRPSSLPTTGPTIWLYGDKSRSPTPARSPQPSFAPATTLTKSVGANFSSPTGGWQRPKLEPVVFTGLAGQTWYLDIVVVGTGWKIPPPVPRPTSKPSSPAPALPITVATKTPPLPQLCSRLCPQRRRRRKAPPLGPLPSLLPSLLLRSLPVACPICRP